MVRRTTATLALALLSGCWDFTGVRDKIGFETNAVVGATGSSWTPDHPLAAGTRLAIRASGLVGQDSDGPPAVTGRATGGLATVRADGPELDVAVDTRRGMVRYRGAARDRFPVHGAPADHANLVDLVDVATGTVDAGQPIALLAGSPPIELTVDLRAADGRSLGYVPTDLETALVVGGPGGPTPTVAPGAGSVSVVFRGQELAAVPILEIEPDALVALELRTAWLTENPDDTPTLVVQAIGRTAAGLAVRGVDVDWNVTGGAVSDLETDRRDVLVVEPNADRLEVRASRAGASAVTAAVTPQ